MFSLRSQGREVASLFGGDAFLIVYNNWMVNTEWKNDVCNYRIVLKFLFSNSFVFISSLIDLWLWDFIGGQHAIIKIIINHILLQRLTNISGWNFSVSWLIIMVIVPCAIFYDSKLIYYNILDISVTLTSAICFKKTCYSNTSLTRPLSALAQIGLL